MKTVKKIQLLLLILSGSLFSTVLGHTSDSLRCIEVKGKVAIPKTVLSRNYKIILLCNNVIVDSGDVVDDEPFLLRIKTNSLYSIRIVKPGYSPMVVSLNTQLSNLKKQKFNFSETYFLDLHGFNLSLSLLNQPMLAEIDPGRNKD